MIIPTKMSGLKNVITIKVLLRTRARYSLLMINFKLRILSHCFNENIVY